MAIMREWLCLEHGEFDGTHPICPGNGCDSAHVSQEFRTPVGIGRNSTKQFDQGLRRTAETYRIDNFKSAKAGETSFAGRAEPGSPQVLWGDDSRKVLGKSFAELSQVAAKPFEMTTRAGKHVKLEHNNGMRDAATNVGITRRRIPTAEFSAHKSEQKSVERAKALVQ
jgi:hypothetical protein